MSIQIKDFGKTTAGQPVKVGILANDTIEVHILSYGATIQQLLVPDRKGNKVDVVLGYPTVQDYEHLFSGRCGGPLRQPHWRLQIHPV